MFHKKIALFLSIVFVAACLPLTAASASSTAAPDKQCILTGGITIVYCRWEWRYDSKAHLAGLAYSDKRVCDQYTNDTSYSGGNLICQISNMTETERTFTATVGGKDLIGTGSLTAQVGYTVDQATTVTGQYQIPSPAYTVGGIWVQAVFNDRYTVKQQRWTCVFGGGRSNPKDASCEADPGVFAYATTEKYRDRNFSQWINKINH